MVLGASPLQRLRWVIWPAVRRPLLLGSAIVAAFTIGAFEVPLTVGPNYPPTLATYAFEATQGDVISGRGDHGRGAARRRPARDCPRGRRRATRKERRG